MGKRTTQEEYHKLAKKRGFEWVGEYPKNTFVSTMWRCAYGHTWLARYNNVSNGTGCPYCSGCYKKTEADYHLLAAEKGASFVGAFPKTTRHKAEWRCKNGHEWITTYGGVKAGFGCPHCVGLAKKQHEDYMDLSVKRAFVWVGPLPENTHEKTEWKCKKGHVWNACYSSVRGGTGCPYCSGKDTKTEESYIALAEYFGYAWIADKLPASSSEKTAWRCENGHIFQAAYSYLKSTKRSCPECSNFVNGVPVSKQQTFIAELLGAEPNYSFDDSKRRIDIALVGRHIAIEYDCWYWHGGKEQKDYKRAMALVDLGWSVISVKSRRLLPTLDQLNEAIAQLRTFSYIEIILDDWGKGTTRESI